MDKLELIIPYIMTTVIFVIITVIIFRLLNYALQQQILKSGPVDEYAVKFIAAGTGTPPQSLKWGLLLFFGGLGLVALQYQPFPLDSSPVPYGIEAIFLAVGFIAYYLIELRKKP